MHANRSGCFAVLADFPCAASQKTHTLIMLRLPALFPLFLLALGHPLGVFAQSTASDSLLTAHDAVRMALENNFDIRLARADADIARLNNTKANAGMLPNINLVAGETFTLAAFRQKRVNGDEVSDVGVPSNTASAAVELDWTLFDGRRMYIAKRRLEAQETLGQTTLKAEVQNTTAAVLQAYYDIVRGRLQERALAEVIALNEERLRIAEARLAAGFAAKTDALQARIDLNQRRADLMAQQTATAIAKRSLNILLARAADTPFTVEENLDNAYVPERASLLQKMQIQNPTLLALQQNAQVASLLVEESRTLNKPRIAGIGQLGVNRSDNPAGFALNNTQGGLTVGATLSVPLYTGGNLRRQVDIAQVAAQQAVVRLDAERLSSEARLDNQLAQFQMQRQVLDLEEQNVTTARENLQVSTERFRLGQTNSLEVQSAQNSLEQALARRNLVLYNLKVGEVNLRLLAGELEIGN